MASMSAAGNLREAWARAKQRRWVRWSVELGLAALVFLAVMGWQTRNLIGGGDPAPAFELRDLEGRTWTLDDLKGKPVLLTFWAPWCGVCKAESSNVSGVRKAEAEEAHVLSIVLAYEGREDIQRFVAEQGVDYPVLLGNDRVMRDFKVEAFPTTYYLSEDGRIRRSTVGYTTQMGMRARLRL